MTRTDLDILTRGLAPVIQEHVTKATAALADQIVVLEATIKALEARPLPKDGAPGPQGEKGMDGASGRDGKDGANGEPGAIGPVGPAGEKGADGAPGRDGRDGLPGIAGAPGEKGLDGKDGRDGINGKDGSDGLHGKDGLGFDDLFVEYDGERTVTVKFQRGDIVKAFPVKMPIVLYRGTFDSAKSYDAGDAVTWGGSMWIARESTHSIQPDENSAIGKKTWALSVMRGRQGKAGMKGDAGVRGERGLQGERGPSGY